MDTTLIFSGGRCTTVPRFDAYDQKLNLTLSGISWPDGETCYARLADPTGNDLDAPRATVVDGVVTLNLLTAAVRAMFATYSTPQAGILTVSTLAGEILGTAAVRIHPAADPDADVVSAATAAATAADMAAIEAEITAAEEDIATNAEAISTNAEGIATNAEAIATNAEALAAIPSAVVSVTALPAEPLTTVLYLLTADDDAALGIYRHDGTRYWAVSTSTYIYSGTLGATLTLPDIYDAIYEITLSEALTLTLPTAHKGACVTLIVTNAGDYTITLPAGTKTDTDYAGDETGLCAYELVCLDATAWTWLLAASGVSA